MENNFKTLKTTSDLWNNTQMSVVKWFLVGQLFPLFPQNKIQDEQVQIHSVKILLFVFENQTIIRERVTKLNGERQCMMIKKNE